MRSVSQSYHKSVKLILLLLCVWVVIYPGLLLAQESTCEYLSDRPALENARRVFRSADLECAEMELKELLATEGISRKTKADARLLLASIYFVGEADDTSRRTKVKQELVAVFIADRHWQGELEIRSSEFRKILADAREMAEWRYRNSPELQHEYEQQLLDTTLIASRTGYDSQSGKKDKKWYTKWWAVGSGVGIIAMVAILMNGSDNSTNPIPADTLPPFPDTP